MHWERASRLEGTYRNIKTETHREAFGTYGKIRRDI